MTICSITGCVILAGQDREMIQIDPFINTLPAASELLGLQWYGMGRKFVIGLGTMMVNICLTVYVV